MGMERKLLWEEIVDEHAREPALGAPAGIFLLDGEYHVAAYTSRAETRLVARGALLVASVHFDGAAEVPRGRVPPRAALEPITPRRAARVLGWPRTRT
jgi:hypothetical protein